MYALIDATRFYSECTSIYKPEQRALPVLVTAGQGISIAANRTSTKLGIPKFKPIWESIDKLKFHRGIVYKANFNSFGHISDRFMFCVERYARGSRTFRYSVDEIFISLQHLHSINVCLIEHMTDLRKTVYRETGVPVGAGVGDTLVLAKVASWAAKNIEPFRGLCILSCKHETDAILKKMPVDSLWNIGPKYAKYLKGEGVYTALELKNCDPRTYQKRYSITVANVINELNGVSAFSYSDLKVKKKQIWSTLSYRDRLSEPDVIFGELAHHCSEAMLKVRKQESEAKKVSIILSTSPYDQCQSFIKREDIEFESATLDTGYVLNRLREIFHTILPDNLTLQPIYRIGVGITQIIDCDNKQYELFDGKVDNNRELTSVLDSLNNRFGKGTITYGSQQRTYNETDGDIKFSRLEDYFTDLEDLLKVKCI